MKQEIKIFCYKCILSFLSACTFIAKEQRSDTVQVKIPWNTNGQYSLQVVSLNTVEDVSELRGKAAKFYLSPTVVNGALDGYHPKTYTMKTRDGILIPTDYLSAQLFTLYAHFEKINELDLAAGIQNLLPGWPRQNTVAVGVNLEKSDYGSTDNAVYTNDLDAFLFLPYTKSFMPFSINAGVIAHEHFHSIFYYLVLKDLNLNVDTIHSNKNFAIVSQAGPIKKEATAGVSSQNKSKYMKFLVKALNEGLADVWGWVYSKDVEFVERSIPNHDRSLNVQDRNELTVAMVQSKVDDLEEDPSKTYEIYEVGTMYARKLYQVIQNNPKLSSKKLAEAVLISLPQIKDKILSLKEDELLDPKVPLEVIQKNMPEVGAEQP